MKPEDLNLDATMISGDEGTGIVTGLKPVYKYVEGKPTEEIVAMKLSTVFPNNGYEKLEVKVLKPSLQFSEKELGRNGGTLNVKYTNLSGRFYRFRGNHDYTLSITADAVEVI